MLLHAKNFNGGFLFRVGNVDPQQPQDKWQMSELCTLIAQTMNEMGTPARPTDARAFSSILSMLLIASMIKAITTASPATTIAITATKHQVSQLISLTASRNRWYRTEPFPKDGWASTCGKSGQREQV